MKKSCLCWQGDLLPPSVSQLLTNYVQAFPRSCLWQARVKEKSVASPGVTQPR